MVLRKDRSKQTVRWLRGAWLALLCCCSVVCSDAVAKRRPKIGKTDAAASTTAPNTPRPSRIEPPPAGEPGAPDLAGLLQTIEAEYRRAPSPELLYELGVLANLSGRTVDAQDLLRRFLADPLSVAGSAGWAEAEATLSAPRPAAGEVHVVADDEGLVQVDDRWIGALPLPLPLLLPVGRHQIVVEMRGKTMRTRVDVKDGRAVALRFNRESGAVVATLPPAVILLPDIAGLQSRADLVRRVEETTAKALQQARLSLYDRGAALRREPQLVGCLSKLECQAQLALRSEVDYALPLRIEQSPTDGEYSVRLALVDAEVGDVASQGSFRCPRCTQEQLISQLSGALGPLVKSGAGRPRGTLYITSLPTGAQVRQGDRVLGQTPYEHVAFVGAHTLNLSLRGHLEESVTLSVVDAQKAAAQVTLKPVPGLVPAIAVASPTVAPTASALRRPVWRWVVGGISLGLGLALVGVGASGVAVDGQCVRPPEPPVINCRDRFDTLGKGAVLLGVGAGLSLAGVVLWAVPPRRTEPGVRLPARTDPAAASMSPGRAGPLPGLLFGRE